MIEIQHVSKRFGRFIAVNDLSLSVPTGQVLGFLGPNGAGKSTTMRMIAGFLQPDAGLVRLGQHDVGRQPLAARRLLGYLPEGAPAYGEMRVQSFLTFVAAARGLGRRQRIVAVDQAMERLQLQSVGRQPVNTLSKGFQRRLGLAQALLHDPRVLLLDEPTDGLDPNQKFQVRQLIRDLSSDKTVVISTHILEEVEAVCQRAVIINRGQLVSDATPAQLKQTSDYYRAVELEVAEPQALLPALQALAGVRDVRLSPEHPGQLLIMPQPGVALLDPVQQVLRELGIEPRSIAVSGGRLDDVFRRITGADSLVPARASAGGQQ